MCSHRLSPSFSSWPVNARLRGERAFDQMLLEATKVLLYTTNFCPSALRNPWVSRDLYKRPRAGKTPAIPPIHNRRDSAGVTAFLQTLSAAHQLLLLFSLLAGPLEHPRLERGQRDAHQEEGHWL